jgi:hypothetical protein
LWQEYKRPSACGRGYPIKDILGGKSMKYRKKPIVIEAEQYTKYGKLVKGMCNSRSCYFSGNDKPHVHTIHDNQIVNLEVGDFIIPESDGIHYYPCKSDIFKKTYEIVGE